MATLEQLVFNGLALNDVTNYRLQAFDAPPPKKRYEWAAGGDTDGAALIRDPLFENREITARVRVTQRTTMDAALAAIGSIVDRLEEAEKHPEGLDLVWTPANSVNSVTFKVLSGEVTGLPVTMDGDDAGWFKNAPVVELTFTCKPYGYGSEVVGSGTSSATPFVSVTVASIPGDAPAEGRLIVTDAATQARRYMEWGLEQRYYNASNDPLVDSDSMVVTGTAGAQTTRSGAYDPNATGNNVIRASLWAAPVVVAATGNLGHIGTYRVKARVYGAGTGPIYARFSWQEGDGPFRSNAYAAVQVLGAFSEIDLGLITIPEKDSGTQRWSGRVEAYSLTPSDTIDVDYLVLMPAGEGYGKARGVGNVTASAVNGFDDFATLAGAGLLNARVAPSGGTWSTAGATTDFAGGSGSLAGLATRTTTADASRRLAVLGATNYTDTQTEVVFGTTTAGAMAPYAGGVIARYVDSSNYLYMTYGSAGVRIGQVVAGTDTVLATFAASPIANTQFPLRLTVFASGVIIGEIRMGSSSSDPFMTLRTSTTAAATGGALATGKPGFLDQNSSGVAATRYYDYFSVATPTSEPVVINSTRAMEVRSDTTIRADSSNTYWGPVPAYRGSRFLLPPAGSGNRTSRVVVKAHRQDIESADASNVTDNLTVAVAYTPRYLVVPR